MTLPNVVRWFANSDSTPLQESHQLILTGQCQSRRHAVVLDNNWIWLTGTSFLAVVDLVAAHLCTYSGYTAVPSCCHGPEGTRLVIHRLRKELRRVVTDAELISSDGNTRYKLHLPPNALAVDASFFELPVPSFISRDAMAVFRFEMTKQLV